MRTWLIRVWQISALVIALMLIPGVALADNCSGGGLGCWGSVAGAAASAAAAGAVAAAAAGWFFGGNPSHPSGRFFAGGDQTGVGPNDPQGGRGDSLGDLLDDITAAGAVGNPPPPQPTVFEAVYDELRDFVRAQKEGWQDFWDGVEEVGEDMREEIVEEIKEDFREDPTNRYGD